MITYVYNNRLAFAFFIEMVTVKYTIIISLS